MDALSITLRPASAIDIWWLSRLIEASWKAAMDSTYTTTITDVNQATTIFFTECVWMYGMRHRLIWSELIWTQFFF